MIRANPKKSSREISRIAKIEAERLRQSVKEECIKDVNNITLPVILTACKDELKLTDNQLKKLSERIDRYFDHLADKSVSIKDFHRILEAGE